MDTLTIWRNGAFEEHEREACAQFAAGMHYGVGVFEGVRAYATARGAAIFRFGDHLARMERGAEALRMYVDTDDIVEATFELIRRNGVGDAYIRPMAWWGGGELHIDLPTMARRQVVMVLPWAPSELVTRGAHVTTRPAEGEGGELSHALKLSGSYVNTYLDKRQAKQRGFDGVIYVEGDRVVRASSENVFVVHGDRITAVDHPEALDGITRQTIRALTGAEARPVTTAELADADEIFLVGTSAEVTPVTRFDDRVLPIGRVTTAVREAYLAVVQGRDPAREHWLTYVPGASTPLARSAK